MRPNFVSAIQTFYRAYLMPSWLRYSSATKHPELTQGKLLKRLLKLHSPSRYGRAYNFWSIDSARDFQARVPIVTYEALTDWMSDIAQGQQGVLTETAVRMFERTSGSSAAYKLIPYTKGLINEFSEATHPWLYNLYQTFPKLSSLRSYWAMSAAKSVLEKTDGGIPVGISEDTEYFNPFTRWSLTQVLSVSRKEGISNAEAAQDWRYRSALALLNTHDLGLISVWSPTFLTLLMQSLEANLDQLINELPPARRLSIRYALERVGSVRSDVFWPDLQLISCWADGPSRSFLPALKRYFPDVPIQGKGLLATEGVLSIPIWGQTGTALAVNSHFFEFLDLEHPKKVPLLAHELEIGGSYSPLLTTSGGLYRYHLQDMVSCIGKYNAVPLLRFDGKLDGISDLHGEKVTARLVDVALNQAKRDLGLSWEFVFLAPVDKVPPYYCLYIESSCSTEIIESSVKLIEDVLLANHHYNYCVTLGQLGRLRYQRIEQGWKRYEAKLIDEGMKRGEITSVLLERRTFWEDVFGVATKLGQGDRP